MQVPTHITNWHSELQGVVGTSNLYPLVRSTVEKSLGLTLVSEAYGGGVGGRAAL